LAITRFLAIKQIVEAKLAHNRKIVLGGASLTTARCNPHDLAVMEEIMAEFEPIMLSAAFFSAAPFTWVGLLLRYGLKNENRPHYQGIDERDGEIALAIELDTHDLQHASREELKNIFTIATLKTLVDVGKKYNLPYQKFEEMLTTINKASASKMC
jgi:hypothetical protein